MAPRRRLFLGARLLLALAACHAGSSSSSSPPSACAGQRLVAARSPGPGDCSAAAWAFVALRQPLEQRPAHWGAQVGGERAHARNAVATPAARSARLGRGLCCSAKTETAHDVAVGDPARSPAPLPMPASTPAEALVLEEIEWHDTWFDRLLQRVLRDRILRALAQGPQGDDAAAQGEDDAAPRVAHKGSSYIVGLLGGERGHEDYDSMISAALMLSRKPGPDTRARTLSLLYDLFPSWFAPAFGAFLSWWPMWFDARHAAASSVLLTKWLVGPSKVVDVDPAVLDPDTRPGWGNEPSGWVPGFALGGRWRKETGAGQGVEIERCRVLDASGCAAVCANVCKGPTQDFFTLGVGLPLTMVPDFERRSCSFIFGATPPPLEEDPVFQQACLASCALISAPSSSGAEDARRWVERDVEERLQAWRDSQTSTPLPVDAAAATAPASPSATATSNPPASSKPSSAACKGLV